jgi:hypothetical protein
MPRGDGARVEREGFRYQNDTYTTEERGALFLDRQDANATGQQEKRHIKAKR